MKRSFSPPLRFRSIEQVKLVTARMCVFLLCLPWWLYGLYVLILEVLGLSLCSHSKSLLLPLKKELLLILMDYHVAIFIILPKHLLILSKEVLKKLKSLEEVMLHSQEPSAL